MGTFFSTLFIIPAPIASVLIPILQSIWSVWAATWWIFTPLIAAFILWDFWLIYLHVRFGKSIKWQLLEIHVPKDVLKTPKAMEQIFAAAHAPYSYGIKPYDKYVKGADELSLSFEIVGRAGETHFYLRLPDRLRNMMEAAIFAQYPNAEIVQVDDYLKELPHVLPSEDIDVAGFEEVFGKPPWYPIRTYPSFEESVEEQRLDSIAPLIESMSKMTGDQQFWFQLVIVPTGDDWVKKGEAEIRKIHGIEEKKESHGGGFLPKIDLGFTLAEVIRSPFEPPGGHGGAKSAEKPAKPPRTVLTPSEKSLTEGISEKISKLGFKTTIRFLFLERRGETPGGVDRNMMFAHGYMRQFNTQNMNTFRPDKEATSASFSVKGFFKKQKIRFRKRMMFDRYAHIAHSHHAPVLNIEELATLYHFPITAVSSTQLEKIESKKGSPPPGLPMVDDEESAE
jgi:hypothetical protein